MTCPYMCYCGLMCKCGCLPHLAYNSSIDMQEKTTKNNTIIYILLLGAAETGKSTMMRQMKIIEGNGMSPQSLRSYKNYVLLNLFNCVNKLIEAVIESNLGWKTKESTDAATILGDLTKERWNLHKLENDPHIPVNHAQLIENIWYDNSAQECWNKANEYNLPDSLAYYLNSAKRICQHGYVPSQEDVLRLRIPTESQTMNDFTLGNLTLRITDVGGQKGQRRRWMRLFDDLNTVIFLASLSEYDQYWKTSEEDENINRLELSLQLFKETIGYRGFDKTCIILFLNKTDVLQQKVQSSDIRRYFPDYEGPYRDAKNVTKFIKSKFITMGDEQNKLIYDHETCATDTSRTKYVFTAVKDNILFENLKTILS